MRYFLKPILTRKMRNSFMVFDKSELALKQSRIVKHGNAAPTQHQLLVRRL